MAAQNGMCKLHFFQKMFLTKPLAHISCVCADSQLSTSLSECHVAVSTVLLSQDFFEMLVLLLGACRAKLTAVEGIALVALCERVRYDLRSSKV